MEEEPLGPSSGPEEDATREAMKKVEKLLPVETPWLVGASNPLLPHMQSVGQRISYTRRTTSRSCRRWRTFHDRCVAVALYRLGRNAFGRR